MVLESLIGVKTAERKPWEMFFIGLVYSSIAVFLGLWIFREEASLVTVFLTVMVTLPLMYKVIKTESDKDLIIKKESKLLKEHKPALKFFTYLFLGFVISFTLWYLFLPADLVRPLFNTQITTIETINSRIVTHAISDSLLSVILANNLKVLFLCIFFSFFFGSGALFILTWNASVISTAIGTFIRQNLSKIAEYVGFAKVGGYLHIFSLGLLRYLTHGVPEILAYFVGGLAGGIISVAVIRYNIDEDQFKRTIIDSLDLVLLSVVILIIAALIEVYITPLMF